MSRAIERIRAALRPTVDAPTQREKGAGEGEYSAEYSTECARCGTQPLNYPKPLQSLGEYLTGLLDDDQWAKAEGMLHDVGRLLNTRPEAASASVSDISPSADLPKLGQPAEAPGWRGDAAVAAFRERLELRIREAVDQVARMAGHTSGASLSLKGFDRFLDCLCDAAAGAALASAPRDAGREEAERDRIDAERWRAIRSHLRIMGGESHPFVEFLEPNGFIDEEDFVDDNGVAITPEPTFEQLLDRYRAARRGATG